MVHRRAFLFTSTLALLALSQVLFVQKLADIPTRPVITQRILVLSLPEPKAAVQCKASLGRTAVALGFG
jgi:hypothetical protein